MENLDLISKYKAFFFVGIGGVSMSGLASFLMDKGYKISGSDRSRSALTEKLEDCGAKIFYKHSRKNLDGVEVVVYSSAINETNPELKRARELGLKIIKRSELLGAIIKEFKTSIAISGCHGKTTTTAMLSKILILSGLDPTVFLGGEYSDFGNYRKGDSEYAVVEACEFRKSFLDLSPKISVVLNIDNDHMDSYNGMSDLVDSFKQFVGENLSVVNADDRYAEYISNCTTVTFGVKSPATYYAKDIRRNKNGYSFTACAFAKACGRINLRVLGKHNIYNALCAFAVSDLLGVDFKYIKRGLEDFCGVKRRNEYLGNKFGMKWFADYAHHPTELKATIDAFSSAGKDFITVFQPHTYSRTERLMQDFIKVLKPVKNLIVYKTYSAREKFLESGSAKTLCDNLTNADMINCAYAQTNEQLEGLIKYYSYGNDRVLVLGAGDIYERAKSILDKR